VRTSDPSKRGSACGLNVIGARWGHGGRVPTELGISLFIRHMSTLIHFIIEV